MNILVIIHNQKGTGPFYKVLEMCRVLARQNKNVDLICTSDTRRIKLNISMIEGVRIIESPDLLFGRLRQGIDLWNLFRRIFFLYGSNYDLIYSIDCRPVVIFPSLYIKNKLKNVKFIIGWWDLYGSGGTATDRSGKLYAKTLGLIESFFEEYFRKFADGATVVSSYLKKYLNELGFPEKKIKLIRVGSDTSLSTQINKNVARETLKLPLKRRIFCYTGHIFPEDKKILIDSLKYLKKQCSKMPITIMTGHHNISDNLCKKLSILKVGRLDTLKEVYHYMYASDFGILPYSVSIANMARWPSKISDYFSAGKPVVATPVSDLLNINSKYNNMIVAESDKISDFSSCLIKTINMDDKLIDGMGNASLYFASENLDWKILNKKLINLYKILDKI